MYHYTIWQWLLFFYIYCFLGWCWETSYVSIKKRHFENRGFLQGPVLPIYGSGAIMMLIVAEPFHNVIAIYFAGVIGATALELLTGIVMEAMFKVRYWDYSTKFCNYKGYICLGSSAAWGFFTIILTKYVHKPIEHFILGEPTMVLNLVAIGLSVCMLTDFMLSFHGAFKWRGVMHKVKDAVAGIGELENRVSAMIGFSSGRWERYITHRHLRRIRGNATMVSRKYKNSLEDVKELLKNPSAIKELGIIRKIEQEIDKVKRG